MSAYSKYSFPPGYKVPSQPYSRFGYDGELWVPAKLGKGFAVMPSFGNADPPSVFVAGQSNAGIQDEIAGTPTDRVTLNWSSNAIFPTINGPIPMQLQSGGHSFEWNTAVGLSNRYNKPIIASKYYVDGSVIDLWLPGDVAFAQLSAVMEQHARQAVAAGTTQVLFIWSQGESNTRTDLSGLLPTFESDTVAVFDGVKDFFAAYGLSTRFLIIKINSNIVTGPNPADPSAASIAFIGDAQENIAATRDDTDIINFNFMVPATGGGVHYAHGQTNIGGDLIASLASTIYNYPQPALTTPPTVEAIMSGSVVFDYDARAIVGLNNNDPIVSWPDLGPGGHTLAPVGAARPLYKTNTLLGTLPVASFDGVDDTCIVPGLSLVAPGVTPIFSMLVMRQKTWTLNDRFIGSSANFTFSVYQSSTSPKVAASAGSAGIDFNGLAVGVFGKVENYFSNNGTDYIQCIDTITTTGSLGNSPPGIVAMAQTNNSGFGDLDIARWCLCSSKPTTSQRNKLRGYGSKNYTLAVWGGR